MAFLRWLARLKHHLQLDEQAEFVHRVQVKAGLADTKKQPGFGDGSLNVERRREDGEQSGW